MYATDKYEKIMLNLARGISATAPAKMWLGLFLTDPGDEGTGTEVSYSGYERQEITFSEPAALNGGGKVMENTSALTFAEAAASVGSCGFIGVLDSKVGGNMYLRGTLSEALVIEAGIAPVVRASAIKWMWTGKMSDAYRIKVMNLLRGVNVAGFTPYLALCNGSPESGGSEFSGNAYARTPVTFAAPAAQANGSMLINNSVAIASPIATGTWGTLTKIAIYDAESNGEPYLIDDASNTALMTAGRAVRFKVNTLNFTIN